MNSQNSSEESLEMDCENTKMLDLMTTDLLVAKKDLENTIDEIKRSISLLFSYIGGSKTRSDSLKSLVKKERRRSIEETASQLFEKSLLELQRKATLDLKFVQLYDKFMAKELAFNFKNRCVKKNFGVMKKKFQEDFRKLNEETERTVKSTKSKLQKYIGINTEENRKNTEFLDTDVLMKFKEKAINDLQHIKKQSEKDIQKTKMRINENIGVFLTNPTGPKTHEELESEQFIKDQIITLKQTVAEDLKASKEITEKIASRTKQAIENFSFPTDDISQAEYQGFNFTVENLQEKAVQDFNEAKTEMEHKVSNIKETFQNSIRDVNSAVTTAGRDNPETSPNISVKQKTELPSNDKHIQKLKNDFQTIDGKMKENANDLKVGITDLVNNVKQKLQDE